MAYTEEDVFVLPADVVGKSIGFNFDAGGSDTKLLYRSKKDYKNGKPINPSIPEGKGLLRMAHFHFSQGDELINFLTKECDIDHTISDKTISVTGIYTDWYEKKIKDCFGISLRRVMEYDYQVRALSFLFEHLTTDELFLPEDEEAVREGKAMMKIYSSFRDIGEQQTVGSMFVVSEKDKLSYSAGGDTPAAGKSSSMPFMMTQVGSAISMHKIESDWSFNLVELSHVAGRAFMGVSTALCDEPKSYNELMEMAATGDSKKVDVYSYDVKLGTGEDVYDELEDGLYFNFGKPAFKSIDSFEKADLMASWVHSTCSSIADYAHLAAFAHGVKRVIIIGGFFNHPLARHNFIKRWHGRFLHVKERNIELQFLKNSQFLGVLGAHLSDAECNGTQKH